MLSDAEHMSFAGDREKPPIGQILLSLAHPISHPKNPIWDSGAEVWECRLEQGPGQKGSSRGAALREILGSPQLAREPTLILKSVPQRIQVSEGEEAEEKDKG